MTFDVNNFRSNAFASGFLKPSLFFVRILPPAWVGKTGKNQEFEELSLLCSTASLPGVTIVTSDERIYGYGRVVKMPYDFALTDLQCTFYVDASAKVVDIFHAWTKHIVAHGRKGSFAGGVEGEVAYRNQYATTIELYQYTEKNIGGNLEGAVIKVTLDNAYPYMVAEMPLSWDDGDTISRLGVTFAYESYDLEILPAPRYTQRGLFGFGGGEGLADPNAPWYAKAAEFVGEKLAGAATVFTTLEQYARFAQGLFGISEAGDIRDAMNRVNNIGSIISNRVGTATNTVRQITGGRFP